MDRINVAIAFDDNYLQPFYALITSIFLNNKDELLTIHCITQNVPEAEKQRIAAYADVHRATIRFYSVDYEQVSKFVTANHWTASVYYKIFFPLLVPIEVKRLLYIDTDTLVVNSLAGLYRDTNLQGYPLAAVYDNYVKTQPALGIHEEGRYFNSGVMLIDLAEWQKRKISEQAIAFLQEHPEKITYVDQDALNMVLKNNWLRMEYKYNVLHSYVPHEVSHAELARFLENVVVIHFTLQRPWHFLCQNRFRYLYAFYLRKSPAGRAKVVVDFSYRKLYKFFQLRMREFYLDQSWFRMCWRVLKQIKIEMP
jgi:lipopolysaccharide biosynthesis glycosyltransferase